MYLHCNLCYSSGDLLTTLLRVKLKNTMSGNFQKSKINSYTWNFTVYDIPPERQEFKLYGNICYIT